MSVLVNQLSSVHRPSCDGRVGHTMGVHSPLISVILIDPSTVSLVHLLMVGLPLLHLPNIVPCIVCFSLVFSWYDHSFLAFTKSNNSSAVPAVFRTHSFVFFAVGGSAADSIQLWIRGRWHWFTVLISTVGRHQCTNRPIPIIGKTANNRPIPTVGRLSVHL